MGASISKESAEARQFTVDADDDGIRLDRWFQRHLPERDGLLNSLLLAGAFLFLAACTSSLGPATLFVGLMGVTVGPVYVMGFVLLQQEVDDELRARLLSDRAFARVEALERFELLRHRLHFGAQLRRRFGEAGDIGVVALARRLEDPADGDPRAAGEPGDQRGDEKPK